MVVTLDALADVTLEAAWTVGFENAPISLGDNAAARIQDGRAGFERLLTSDNARFVYGSTTAPGVRAKTRLSGERQEQYEASQNLWAPKAFGGGSTEAPEHAVRLIVLARVAGYLEGHGRIRLDTARWVADLLSRPMSRFPLDSATGPGEVMPLSWLYQELSEVDLAAGEIMALYNGSPCATAFVTDAALTAARRLSLAERIFALTIEAAGAPLDAYDPVLQQLTADPHHRSTLKRLDALLRGVPEADRLPHQAPVSWRIIPTVLATAARAVHDAEEAARQSLQSIAHNPVYIPPDLEHPDGRALSPGGFHNQPASRAIDTLNAAGADLCALAAKHTSRLLDGAPFGLPRLLVEDGSAVIGTEFLAWSQTSHAERARQSAAPSVLTIGLEDPGGGQSDVASPVFLAFERYLDVADSLDAALATLSIVVIQAFRISGRRAPPELLALHQAIDEAVTPFELEQIAHLGGCLRQLKVAYSDAITGKGNFAALI